MRRSLMRRRTAQNRQATAGKPTSISIWWNAPVTVKDKTPVEMAVENESRPRLRKLFWNLQRGVHPNAQARRVRSPIMYLWRKVAHPHWIKAREEILQARFGGALSIISRPERKRVQIEIACTSRSESRRVVQEFGGRAKRLGRRA